MLACSARELFDFPLLHERERQIRMPRFRRQVRTGRQERTPSVGERENRARECGPSQTILCKYLIPIIRIARQRYTYINIAYTDKKKGRYVDVHVIKREKRKKCEKKENYIYLHTHASLHLHHIQCRIPLFTRTRKKNNLNYNNVLT